MLIPTLEEFLVKADFTSLINNRIFFHVPHGRTVHWIGACRKIYALCFSLGLKPRLALSNGQAIPGEMSQVFDQDKLTRFPGLAMGIHTVYASDMNQFFSNSFNEFMRHKLVDSYRKKADIFLRDDVSCLKRYLSSEHLKEQTASLFAKYQLSSDCEYVTVHLRRGDLAILQKASYANTPLYNHFQDDYFLFDSRVKKWNFLSRQEVSACTQESTGETITSLRRHEDHSYFLRNLSAKIKKHQNSGKSIFLFTDGFTRAAQAFARHTSISYSSSAIEVIMNEVELSVPDSSNIIVFAGEPSSEVDLSHLLHIAMYSSELICMGTAFPAPLINLLA